MKHNTSHRLFKTVDLTGLVIKNRYLLIFDAGLYLILPMVLAGLFDNEYLAVFSPFGVIYSYEMYHDIGEILPPFIVNMVILIPLLLMIGMRYLKIEKLRSRIDAEA